MRKLFSSSELFFKYLVGALMIVLVVSLFFEFDLEMKPGKNSEKVYELMERVPSGSKILIVVNYGPEAKYELEDALSSIVGYFAAKEVGVVFVTLTPVGVESAFMAVEKSLKNSDFIKRRYLYGNDYVHLGYIAGNSVGAFLLSANFSKAKKLDIYGGELDTFSVMNGITQLDDFAAVFEVSSRLVDGIPGITLFSVFSKDKELPKIAICSSDMVPNYLPFYKSDSFQGFVGGFKDVAGLVKTIDPSSNIWKKYGTTSIVLCFILFVIIVAGVKRAVRGEEK
ncbi:MAG: hypothetical protein ACOX2F_07495 [bacterium]